MKIINIILNKLFTVFTINKSPFKNNYFNILLIIGIITSLIIRLDYIYNLLNNLPYELNVSLRLSSGLYSIIILFLLMINIKQFKDFYKYFYNLEDKKISILILYNIYFIYFSLVSLIILIINYQSILSLNINYLDIIFLCLSLISLVNGIYYSTYRFNSEFNLNKTLSFTGKLTFISFILIYLSLFIGIRTGIILEWINKFELIETIHCEGSGSNSNNLNNQLRNNDDRGNIINSNNDSSFTGLTATGSNNTITDNSITHPTNNTATASASRTVSTVTTETISTPVNNRNGNSSVVTNNPLLNDNPPQYTNSITINTLNKGKEVFGLFDREFRTTDTRSSFSSNKNIENLNTNIEDNTDNETIRNLNTNIGDNTDNETIRNLNTDNNNTEHKINLLTSKILQNLNRLNEIKKSLIELSDELKNIDNDMLYKELLNYLKNKDDSLDYKNLSEDMLKFKLNRDNIDNIANNSEPTTSIKSDDNNFYFNSDDNKSYIQKIDEGIDYISDNSEISHNPDLAQSVHSDEAQFINKDIEKYNKLRNLKDNNNNKSVIKTIKTKVSKIFKKDDKKIEHITVSRHTIRKSQSLNDITIVK